MTLEQALAYLTPHPHTNGPVQLTPAKMREAIGVITGAIGALEHSLALACVEIFNLSTEESA